MVLIQFLAHLHQQAVVLVQITLERLVQMVDQAVAELVTAQVLAAQGFQVKAMLAVLDLRRLMVQAVVAVALVPLV
jgi:hypothetical protein